jgi:hypothetical protein
MLSWVAAHAAPSNITSPGYLFSYETQSTFTLEAQLVIEI